MGTTQIKVLAVWGKFIEHLCRRHVNVWSLDCCLRAVWFFSLFEIKSAQQSETICVLPSRFKILYEILVCPESRSFLPSRIQRKPIYRFLNDLIAAHVAGEWGGLEAVAWGQSSGMTVPGCSTAETHGGLREKHCVEHELREEPEITEGIKSPDCVWSGDAWRPGLGQILSTRLVLVNQWSRDLVHYLRWRSWSESFREKGSTGCR